MLFTSHLAITVFVANKMGLSGPETMLALAAGVGIDLDHFFVNKKWIQDIKSFFSESVVTHGEVKQHSWLQEPFFGLIAGLLAGFTISYLTGARWWIFPSFQALHIFMDSLMNYDHEPFVPFSFWKYRGWIYPGTRGELAISIIALGIIYLEIL